MPSCPTVMGFAVAARERPVSGTRDATALSSFHMPCNHPPLHVDFKHHSALWNGSRFLRHCSYSQELQSLACFSPKIQSDVGAPLVLRKQVADIEGAGVRRVAYGKPWYSFSNPSYAAVCHQPAMSRL